jgi:hypothetical protein
VSDRHRLRATFEEVPEEAARRRLYERIHRRIESRPGGTVRKTYLGILDVARRAG